MGSVIPAPEATIAAGVGTVALICKVAVKVARP
jgi:hypothetical protein